MKTETIPYLCGGKTYKGALIYDERASGPRPLLLMSPNWCGVSAEAIARAGTMAGDKYIAFVADMYGDGKAVAGPPEAAELADALRADVSERRARIAAALNALTLAAVERGIGDAARRAAVGFCFGGGNVLELARDGADIQAVVALHSDLVTKLPATAGAIRAAIMVMHGAADPVAPKAHRDAFEAEMEGVKAKWQMLTFGGLVHSFCEPEGHVPGIAEYNEPAARQSYRLIDQFIADAFAGRL